VGPSVLDREVPALHVAEVTQALPEGFEPIRGVSERPDAEETDPGGSRGGLGLDGAGRAEQGER
jgi:hypothetical protein